MNEKNDCCVIIGGIFEGRFRFTKDVLVQEGGVLGVEIIGTGNITVEKGGRLEGNVYVNGNIVLKDGCVAECDKMYAREVHQAKGSTLVVNNLYTGPNGHLNSGGDFAGKVDMHQKHLRIIEETTKPQEKATPPESSEKAPEPLANPGTNGSGAEELQAGVLTGAGNV